MSLQVGRSANASAAREPRSLPGRRQFLWSGVAAAAAMLPVSCGQPAPEEKPNIVYIMVDDLGFDLGCYGGKQIQTPRLDQMAREGMRFTEAYSGCTVCAPARSTLLTGTHTGHTPVRRNSGGVSLQADTVTVADMLTRAGYVCGGFGKWGVGDLDTPGVPERHGFARFFGYYHQVHAHYFYPEYLIDSGRKVPLPGNEGAYAAEAPVKSPGAFPRKNPVSGEDYQFSHYLVMEEMKGFLREHKDQPFFCYGPWTIPHGRFEIPEDDPAWALYKDKPWSMQARVYAAYATLLDRNVGEVLDLLEELGIAAKTMVIFCSDNGAASQYPGELDSTAAYRGSKTSMYEGGLRVPLIARWPGRIAAGSTSDAPIYFPDFLPTAAEISGVAATVPQKLDGLSYAGELLGTADFPREREMYWEWNRNHFDEYEVYMQAFRRGNWKLVRHDPTTPWELYDIVEDPGEKNDVAAAHPDRVAQMAAWIDANRTDPPKQIEPDKPEGQRWR
jgi:arylsulfatase A